MCRKALCLIFAFLFSIESMAAVVSDNDGSAFITKAEFDSLKNDFQKQVDQFNTSIDSRIVNAISLYLAEARVSNGSDRGKECDATSWTFYTPDSYPKFQDGFPYIDGYCTVGHTKMAVVSGETHRVCWGCLHVPGVEQYKVNGGYKKHFVDKLVSRYNLIGGNRYYGAYAGYYQNEGEWIHLGGWSGNLDSGTWAHEGETAEYFTQNSSFANLLVPATVYTNYTWRCPTGYAWDGATNLNIIVQAAERIPGAKVYGNNVGIYKDISDDRFYQVDYPNRVGITATTPAITRTAMRDEFGTWWDTVAAGRSIEYASANFGWTADNSMSPIKGYWTPYPGAHAYGKWTITPSLQQAIDSGYVPATRQLDLLKLANDPNGMQFKYLWSPATDPVAIKLHNMLSDGSVSDTVKNDIRNVLIYDNNNTPHLSMIAGFPFLTVKKGEKVQWKFTSIGTYGLKTMIVIGKYGPFTNLTEDPNGQYNLVFSNGSSSDNKVFIVDTGGKNILRFTAEQDGIIFLKWYVSGTTPPMLDTTNDPYVEEANK